MQGALLKPIIAISRVQVHIDTYYRIGPRWWHFSKNSSGAVLHHLPPPHWLALPALLIPPRFSHLHLLLVLPCSGLSLSYLPFTHVPPSPASSYQHFISLSSGDWENEWWCRREGSSFPARAVYSVALHWSTSCGFTIVKRQTADTQPDVVSIRLDSKLHLPIGQAIKEFFSGS